MHRDRALAEALLQLKAMDEGQVARTTQMPPLAWASIVIVSRM